MASALSNAMDRYLGSAQGEIDLFFMAQDQIARVGPGHMRAEARGVRYDDQDQKKQRSELKAAMISGDKDRIIKAYAIMDAAKEEAPSSSNSDSDIEKKLNTLIEAISKLVETKGSVSGE